MKRRDFIKKSMAAAAVASLAQYDILTPGPLRAENGREPFTRKLGIPPILEESTGPDGMSGLNFTARPGEHSFFSDRLTPTLGYNGTYLGPTIRVRDGQKVRFNVKNELSQVTTVHWHGLHVPAQWDGGPHQVIDPGMTWKPEFRIKQQAATLWYHPHAMGLTGEHAYRGLGGLFIIDDEVSDTIALPTEYGVDDIPLVVQDRRFFEDGTFAYIQSMHDVMHGVLGNYLLVNGDMKPFVDVARGVSRFRLLNGSNSSIYRIRFSDDRPMHVIASDGGFLAEPVPVAEFILAAGERAEFLVDFTKDRAGDKVRFWVDQYGGSSFEAMEVRVGSESGRRSTIPAALRPQPRIPESEADNTRRFAMETVSGGGRGMGMRGGNRLAINGRKMDLDRIDERVILGSTEIWEVINTSASMMQLPHSMHLHDVQFNILDRNGKPPEALEAGRKDTVLLWPNDRVRLIARFLDYTGIYMYHCHMLEHEDDGMMGQFEVVAENIRV